MILKKWVGIPALEREEQMQPMQRRNDADAKMKEECVIFSLLPPTGTTMRGGGGKFTIWGNNFPGVS